VSTTLRGGQRLDEPEMPGGQIVLQPPPELQEGEGAGGVLMNAIPMLGSLGSIVLVATMGGANRSRSFLAAGMFLFASARNRSPARAPSTSATSATSARWPATPPTSSAAR
jgi:S-DNA-T family DNA segregation ATPase FtsK/SpoIIIE